MTALLRGDRAGSTVESAAADFARALREGAARARGATLPSLEALRGLLMLPPLAEPAAGINELLRDAHESPPPVLKAALAAHALHTHATGLAESGPLEDHLPQLAVPIILCAGSATSDAWITLPRAFVATGALAAPLLRDTFDALAREARAAERALGAAHERCAADETRVRNALGRAAYSALDALALLRREIVITIPETARTLGMTPPTAGAAVERLVKLGIAREITGKARLRAFAYDGMVAALAPSATG